MSGTSRRKKRSKFTVLLLSPILVVTFLLGWTLYVLGESRPPKRKLPQKQANESLTKQADVELLMIPAEAKHTVQD